MKQEIDQIRLDRFLWATRQFKTRSLSSDACKKKYIQINNLPAKASKVVKEGDVITIKKPFIIKKIKILKRLKSRVAAKLLQEYILDLTTKEDYEKEKELSKRHSTHGSSMIGRPTKKQRRDLEEFFAKSY